MKSEFAMYLKEKRKEMNVNQRLFAKMIGVSYSYISSLESGKRPAPTPKILKKMEKELGLTPKEIAVFEQLAAKTKSSPAVSYQIADYVNKNDYVFKTLNFAQSRGVKESDWKEFLDSIKGKYF